MRIVILIVIGLVLGALGTHSVEHALNLRSAYPRAVMHIMHHHLVAMRKAVAKDQCNAAASHQNLLAMHNISAEIGPAFGTGDKHFNDLAKRLRSPLDQAAGQTFADCKALAPVVTRIQHHCDDCHREYR